MTIVILYKTIEGCDNSTMTTTVFVSGATGFIAQHIIKQLLESNYKVIGSVRSTEKGDLIGKLFNNPNFSYEIVEAIEKDHAFDAALEKHPEVEVFLHTASPASLVSEDLEKNVLNPAIDGTKNVLRAIHAHGKGVKKVVVTSSITAFVNLRKGITGKINEKSWNDITWEEALTDGLSAYAGSKTFAEKAAWEFVDQTKPSFSLTTVNPVYVFGPQAYDSSAKGTLNTTNMIVISALRLKDGDKVPETVGSYVDVRDVARAHIAAFEKDAAHKRLLLTAGTFNFQEILNVLNEKLPQLNLLKGNPENTKVPNLLDSTESQKILGDKFVDFETTIFDTVKQYLDANK